jgi:tight adherence protein B
MAAAPQAFGVVDSQLIIAVAAGIAGLVLMAGALVASRRQEMRAVDDLLGMRPVGAEKHHEGEAELHALTGRAVELADQVVERVNRDRSLSNALERAQIPLRPGEFLIVLFAAALGVAMVIVVLNKSVLLALVGAIAALLVGGQVVRFRINKRRKAFEAQLPDALGLIASSLSAGHTFLRAIQMMCEESGPPMSEVFARVVAETRLGDPTVDALGRMSGRLQIRDMDMVVQAIRIQQTIGGRLADLLHTLADFIRARDEVRREVKILTAEGRMSAYVLSGLVPMLFLVMNVLNPTYLKPLYSGWGVGILIGCGMSLIAGMFVILRMVKIEV